MKTVLKIIALIVIGWLALHLIFSLVGAVVMVAWSLAIPLFIGLATYFLFPNIWTRVKELGKMPEPAEPLRLYAPAGKVFIFSEKPTLRELTHAHEATDSNRQLVNDTEVSVLADDPSDEVLKIKVLNGDQKGQVAWVERGLVLGYKKQLPATDK